MGQAKNRRGLLGALKDVQPYCIYCGGNTIATTIDHMPPITIFDLRERPKGLEFPACTDCNSGSTGAEQIAGLISRMISSSKAEEARHETKRMMNHIANNHPGLLTEMMPSLKERIYFRVQQKIPSDRHPLKTDGPIINAALNRFAAKLALALHYHLLQVPLPATGQIAVCWYSNFALSRQRTEFDFIRDLGPATTLRQGTKDVADQFSYRSSAWPEENTSVHFALFRQSFGIQAAVTDNLDLITNAQGMQIFEPGFLKF